MRHTSPTDDRWDLDEATIEALVHGHPVDGSLEALAAFARLMRAAASSPYSEPSGELALLLRDDAPIAVPGPGGARPRAGRPRRAAAIAARVAGLGAVSKVALGASLAAASVAGAGAAGVIPGAPGEAVRDAINTVSPVDLPDDAHDSPADGGPGPDAERDRPTVDDGEQPTNVGDEVSDDATGRSDGERGVDGPTIAEGTPGADHRPGPGETPGQGSAPEVPPGAAGPHAPAAPGPPAPTPSSVPGAPGAGAAGSDTGEPATAGRSGTTP